MDIIASIIAGSLLCAIVFSPLYFERWLERKVNESAARYTSKYGRHDRMRDHRRGL